MDDDDDDDVDDDGDGDDNEDDNDWSSQPLFLQFLSFFFSFGLGANCNLMIEQN